MSGISNIFSLAGSSLDSAATRLDQTAKNIASPSGLDNLSQNLVDLSTEKTDFEAGALLLKMADRMTGTLLDILDTKPR